MYYCIEISTYHHNICNLQFIFPVCFVAELVYTEVIGFVPQTLPQAVQET
jgi:hypothetical protein